jgi:hypothetical protein
MRFSEQVALSISYKPTSRQDGVILDLGRCASFRRWRVCQLLTRRKVTRNLTLEYGLRYDFVILLREQYGRMQSADFKKPNPLVSGLPRVGDL